MAWEEWEQMKAAAAEEQGGGAQMRLNQLPEEDRPNTGLQPGDLRVGQQDLAAVGAEAFTLYNQLWDQARVTSTDGAGRALRDQGFALGGALERVSLRWDSQLATLMDACALISNHMRVTRNTHQDHEDAIVRHVSGIATLDAGFNESYGQPGAQNSVYGTDNQDSDDRAEEED
ncbi:hypothetical protein [Streptomyces odonnellii]|uniref:hypothetical protein n=1 Tax=Streptomyces odonnellii TaxID=1417980 RepID=UPI000625116D|nr:hypothetical protein [Streptomyces odonnellii]